VNEQRENPKKVSENGSKRKTYKRETCGNSRLVEMSHGKEEEQWK
jgi:hypothetical protein